MSTLSVLGEIFDKASHLTGVTYSLFEGDPKFITAVELKFESFSVVLRAIADDDTISVEIDTLKPSSEEPLVDVGNSAPWLECLGSGISWAWSLTNQQGYQDGVRFEFNNGSAEMHGVSITLIVVASAIVLYTSVRV